VSLSIKAMRSARVHASVSIEDSLRQSWVPLTGVRGEVCPSIPRPGSRTNRDQRQS
jgi:hypothetical protein